MAAKKQKRQAAGTDKATGTKPKPKPKKKTSRGK
jgi:hypothetical protein